MVCRDKAGWQVEDISNYGPNVVSFVLAAGCQRCYVVGVYVPLKDAPTIARVEEALVQAVKGLEIILLGDIKSRLQELRNAQEEQLVTVVAACSLEDMTNHLVPRGRYRVSRRWTWRMQREGQKITGPGDYVLGTSIYTFSDAGFR